MPARKNSATAVASHPNSSPMYRSVVEIGFPPSPAVERMPRRARALGAGRPAAGVRLRKGVSRETPAAVIRNQRVGPFARPRPRPTADPRRDTPLRGDRLRRGVGWVRPQPQASGCHGGLGRWVRGRPADGVRPKTGVARETPAAVIRNRRVGPFARPRPQPTTDLKEIARRRGEDSTNQRQRPAHLLEIG